MREDMMKKGRGLVTQTEHASFKHTLRLIIIATDRAERLRKSTPSLPINNLPPVHEMFILGNNSTLHCKKTPNMLAKRKINSKEDGEIIAWKLSLLKQFNGVILGCILLCSVKS